MQVILAFTSGDDATLDILSGGQVNISNSLRMCYYSGSSATVRIANGGLLTMRGIYDAADGTANVIVDGGTIRANADNAAFVPNQNNLTFMVGAGGGTIDTNEKNITILKEITGTGGLTFTGGGTATLSGNVKYAAATAVTPGTTLAVANETAKNNILANGLVVAGVPTVGQTVMTYTADLTGADLSKVTCPLRPGTVFAVGGDGNMSIVVESVGEELDNYWTGAVDNDLSNGNNWKTGVVPTDNANIYVSDAVTLTKSESFSPASITFLPGAPVTIAGSELTVTVVSNLSTVVQTFACQVTFSSTYRVHCESAAVNFAGGATATYPDDSITSDNEMSHVLMGNLNFTADWTVPHQSTPFVLIGGTTLTGKKLAGTSYNAGKPELRIDTGATATFESIDVAGKLIFWMNGGRLVSNGDITLKQGDFGCTGKTNTGVVEANGIYKNVTGGNKIYNYLPNLVVGSGGFGMKRKDYNIILKVDTRITAKANFTIYHPELSDGIKESDWGLYLEGKTLVVDTDRYDVIFDSWVREDGGKIVKEGDGKLVMQGRKKQYTGGTTVNGGRLVCAMSNAMGTGETFVNDGATLAILNDVNTGCAVTISQGATLLVSESGRATVGGDLLLADGACLGFNFTNRETVPRLFIADEMKVIFGDAKAIKASLSGVRPTYGTYGKMVLTSSGGQFAGVKVSLAQDCPSWVEGVDVVDGEIVLDVKPIGTKIIVR